jgi:hypothetical protein
MDDPLPPNAAEVLKRFVILKNLMAKALATPPPEMLFPVMQSWSDRDKEEFVAESKASYARQIQSLRDNGLWGEMDEDERNFMLAGPTEVKRQILIDMSWLAESAVCLLWALGYVSELPAYDQEASPDLTNNLPQRPLADLLGVAKLRPPSLIEEQRDIAELWHWRSRTRQLQEEGCMPKILPAGNTIEEELKLTASKAAADGACPAPIDGDFPAFNKAYRDLSFEEYSMATSIAQERHRAFNWLCGYAPQNRWADTPTDT